MKKSLLICLILLLPAIVWGQEQSSVRLQQTDTTAVRPPVEDKKPDAMRAVWMGALVPGLGQIYNESYWKLPIVYGGFMGCIYAITFNGNKYADYNTAYRDLTMDSLHGRVSETDPNKSYNKVLPKGYDIQRMGGVATYTNTLNNWQNTYHRYRDISILATVLVYGLSLIDAFVDAKLYDFDISPDLSLQIEPQIYHDLQNRRSAEIHLAIQF